MEVYTHQFFFWNSISSLLGGPICQILSFGGAHSPQQHYFAKKRYLQKSTFHQKNRWFLYLFSGTEFKNPWFLYLFSDTENIFTNLFWKNHKFLYAFFKYIYCYLSCFLVIYFLISHSGGIARKHVLCVAIFCHIFFWNIFFMKENVPKAQ